MQEITTMTDRALLAEIEAVMACGEAPGLLGYLEREGKRREGMPGREVDKITLREAITRGTKCLRRDPWVPRGRITLHLTDDGYFGPWVTIEDGSTDHDGYNPPKIPILSMDFDERVWEPWEEPREQES